MSTDLPERDSVCVCAALRLLGRDDAIDGPEPRTSRDVVNTPHSLGLVTQETISLSSLSRKIFL